MTRPFLAVTAAVIAVTGLAAQSDRGVPPVPVAAHTAASGEPAEVARRAVRPARPAARRPVTRPVRVAPVAPPVSVARGVAWDGRAFATPEAAMRFLVTAYNRHADDALKHVTTPDARTNLVAMRDFAPALRLTSCARLETGAYDCEFTHSTATSAKQDGYALFRVAPAAKPGWYMTVLAECGD